MEMLYRESRILNLGSERIDSAQEILFSALGCPRKRKSLVIHGIASLTDMRRYSLGSFLIPSFTEESFGESYGPRMRTSFFD